MKKSILLSAIISIFLVLSCTSLSALGDETVTPASKGDSPDLTIKILSVTHNVHYFDIKVEITNIGTSAVPAGETLNVCVKVLAEVDIGNNETIPLLVVDKIVDFSSAIASESLEPQASINGTIIANTTHADSIIHVRVDPPYEDHPNGNIVEVDETNNCDQFVHKAPRPRISNYPVLLKISKLFPRVFSLLRLILRL